MTSSEVREFETIAKERPNLEVRFVFAMAVAVKRNVYPPYYFDGDDYYENPDFALARQMCSVLGNELLARMRNGRWIPGEP